MHISPHFFTEDKILNLSVLNMVTNDMFLLKSTHFSLKSKAFFAITEDLGLAFTQEMVFVVVKEIKEATLPQNLESFVPFYPRRELAAFLGLNHTFYLIILAPTILI